ncbi:MAG: ComF family protein [Firmicutes bacterium]|nr:ComF family protein [Bacillota bacterium]
MKKYICVFCDERKNIDTAYKACGNIGICAGCSERLSRTSHSLPYKGTRNISYIMSPFEYGEPLRGAILDFKFKNYWAYARLFADMMKDYLDSYDIWDEFDYIVPVPLHEKRLKERGYNQAELIAEYVSEYLQIPMRTDLVKRVRATQKQSSLKRIDRVLNVKDAFSCGSDLSGKGILLFDDICTTGNTLQACASALSGANAKNICALTLAIYTEQKMPIIMY